jgi:hypothetical protein
METEMNTKNVREKVLAEAGKGKWVTAQDIAARTAASYNLVAYHLSKAWSRGDLERKRDVVKHLDSEGASILYLYRVPSVRSYRGEIVPPAYRNLRLSENLTDYGDSLSQFAFLCMTVRR